MKNNKQFNCVSLKHFHSLFITSHRDGIRTQVCRFDCHLQGSDVKNQSWDTSSEQLETKLRLAEISGVGGTRARTCSAARERKNVTYGK